MRVVALIQARMASQRLPGKVLEPIQGKPMLQRVIERAKKARQLDKIVVCTTTNPEDDAIAALCDHLRVMRYRGEDADVLARLCGAARAHHADVVVRLTGDCPLLDPMIVDRMVALYVEQKVEYVRHAPDGFDVEVLSRSLLGRTRAAVDRCDPDDQARYREHPTSYLIDHPTFCCQVTVGALGVHLSVDTAEDLEHARHIYATLGESFTMQEAQACKRKRLAKKLA